MYSLLKRTVCKLRESNYNVTMSTLISVLHHYLLKFIFNYFISFTTIFIHNRIFTNSITIYTSSPPVCHRNYHCSIIPPPKNFTTTRCHLRSSPFYPFPSTHIILKLQQQLHHHFLQQEGRGDEGGGNDLDGRKKKNKE